MTNIEPNQRGEIQRSIKRIKRRKNELLPTNFNALLTTTEKLEALRRLQIEIARLVLDLAREEQA